MKTLNFTKAILPGAVVCLSAFTMMAQTLQWDAHYDTGYDDFGRSATYDASGNVYTVGTTYDPFQTQIGVVKYNSSGVQQWVYNFLYIVNYPLGNETQGFGIAVDGSGNVYACGQAQVDATQGIDMVLFKLNSAGSLQWSKNYGSTFSGAVPDGERALAVVLDGSGNSYVTGKKYITSTTSDIVTIKYNSAGTLQWAMTYTPTTTGIDEGRSIKLDASGNVYVAGFVHNGSTNGKDWIVIKYNNSGAQQWATLSGWSSSGNDDDVAYDLKLDGSANAYICGYNHQSDVGSAADGLIAKLNSSGTLLWWQNYNDGGSAYDQSFSSLSLTPNGAYVFVTGYTVKNSTGTDSDYATRRYTSAGVLGWTSTYDDSGPSTASHDYGGCVVVSALGIVYVTGNSEDATTKYDITTLRYAQAGSTIQWSHSYEFAGDAPYNGDDWLGGPFSNWTLYTQQAMATKSNSTTDDIFIAGTSLADPSIPSFGGYNYTTLKYSYLACPTCQGPEFEGRFADGGDADEPIHVYTPMSIYPNPIVDFAKVLIPADETNNARKFSIYDVVGKEVFSAPVSDFNSELYFSRGDLKPGIYFYRLVSNNLLLESGKLIMQ